MKPTQSSRPLAPAFWDTSALLLLICQQPHSQRARAAQRSYPAINVWWGTRIECHSALQRLIRAGDLSGNEERQAFLTLGKLATQWAEIQPSEEVRQFAERLLTLHPLRAMDALQLSAALVWCNRHPHGKTFICGDEKLLDAAKKENFNILNL